MFNTVFEGYKEDYGTTKLINFASEIDSNTNNSTIHNHIT